MKFADCSTYYFFKKILVPCPALFCLFVIFLTLLYIHYSSSGSPAGHSFFLSWVSDSYIWANNFLPAEPTEGCRAGIELGAAAVLQPSALTTQLRRTLTHLATPHPPPSYAAPSIQLLTTLLSFCLVTPHLAELRRTLLNYAAPYLATPHLTDLPITYLVV